MGNTAKARHRRRRRQRIARGAWYDVSIVWEAGITPESPPPKVSNHGRVTGARRAILALAALGALSR